MRVSHGNNPYAHQQQRTNGSGKDKGFADMLAGMAAHKHDKPEAAKNGGHRPHHTDNYPPLRLMNPHKYHGTEIKLTAEQAAELEKMKRGAPSGSECLQKYEEVEKTEFYYTQPYVNKAPDPTYPESIYDIPASEFSEQFEAAQLACYYLDTEGMSKAEIYNKIESIYRDYLGKDFKEPMLIYGGTANVKQDSYEQKLQLVEMYFGMNCRDKGVNIDAEPEILREARGYEGMSESEMRAAVREKYPDVMTAKDCILMADELWNLRLTDGNYGYYVKERIALSTGIGGLSWSPQTKNIYDAILGMPADLDAIKDSHNAFAKNDYLYKAPHNMDNVLKDLLSFFGGSELVGSDLLSKLRAMLDEMEKSGELFFDQYGYCASTINL